MVQLAKECGGPDLFMKGLVDLGKSKMKPLVFIVGVTALVTGALIGIAGTIFTKNHIDKQKKLKEEDEKKKEELLTEIKTNNELINNMAEKMISNISQNREEWIKQ